MAPFFSEHFGNAASQQHVFGWRAREAVEAAREQVAALIGGSAREIVFTSGATESNNLALKGVARLFREKGDHVVTVATEHRAVLDPCARLEREGFRVTRLPVGSDGLVDPDDVARALDDHAVLLSVLHANNEIGVLQPLAELGRLAKRRGVFFHSDAAQSAGKVPLDVQALGLDLVSLSAHKLYGPKGVGALWLRRRDPRVRLLPELDGGGHERGLRSGTLNVPGIVGFGAACALAARLREDEAARLVAQRERLRAAIVGGLPEVTLNGHPTQRLPGNLNLAFAGVEGESLLLALSEVALSSGSACTSASLEPSHVLRAIGLPDELAHGSLRFGLGRSTTAEEVDAVAARVVAAVTRLRELSPLWRMRHGGR
jgi:cysteine desulfurase